VKRSSGGALALYLIWGLSVCASHSMAQDDCADREPGRHHFTQFVSDVSLPLCAIAAGYHLLSEDMSEVETGKRMADAIVMSVGTAGLLKSVISDRRPAPNDSDSDGMPSAHSAICFATAAVIAERKPSVAVPAYCGAALVGWSRHHCRAHYWDQVLVGAALGTYLGHRAGKGDLGIWGDHASDGLRLSFGGHGARRAGAFPQLQVVYQSSF
jgi:hypothetical protein